MKVRQDFVTNSSSSSYIIAYRNMDKVMEELKDQLSGVDERIQTLVKLAIDTFNSILNNDECCKESFKTKQELDQYIVESYGWGDRNTVEAIFDDEVDDWIEDWYNKAVECLANGYEILRLVIDYHEEHLAQVVAAMIDGKSFIMLSNSEE